MVPFSAFLNIWQLHFLTEVHSRTSNFLPVSKISDLHTRSIGLIEVTFSNVNNELYIRNTVYISCSLEGYTSYKNISLAAVCRLKITKRSYIDFFHAFLVSNWIFLSERINNSTSIRLVTYLQRISCLMRKQRRSLPIQSTFN